MTSTIHFTKRDIEAGILERNALELLECLWVKFNNQPAPPKGGHHAERERDVYRFCQYEYRRHHAGWENGVNDVSYLILDCMDEMKLLQPSSNVQISKKTPQKFLKTRLQKFLEKGYWGQPAFYNPEAIIQELLNAGKSLEDARRGGTSGCVETGGFSEMKHIS